MSYWFDRPGVYQIRVAGLLSPKWSDRLGGLIIAQGKPIGGDATPVTVLSGLLPDQAALCGVLNTLYDNRYALLHVEYLGPA